MGLKKLLLVDNSGSTSGCRAYWANVKHLFSGGKFDAIYYWNHRCFQLQVNLITESSSGGTEPICFMEMLETGYKEPLELVVVTDGQISSKDIDKCLEKRFDKLRENIRGAKIYYFGQEYNMNIGLNVIFGSLSKLEYFINSTIESKKVLLLKEYVDELESAGLEQLVNESFVIGFTTRIQEAMRTNKYGKDQLLELRTKIIKAFTQCGKVGNVEKLRELYVEDKRKEYAAIVSRIGTDDMNCALDRQKSRLISSFDRSVSLRIDHLRSYGDTSMETMLQTTAFEEDDKHNTEDAWTSFEDEITFDKLDSLPCLLIQEACIVNIEYQKDDDGAQKMLHPFELLLHADIVDCLAAAFEKHVVSFQTVVKIGVNSSAVVQSPFTRQDCWVFVLAPRDMKHLKYNARAISRLFGRDFKIPGNLVLWNLIFAYIVYKRVDVNDDNESMKSMLIRELCTFCKTFDVPISLSVKSTISNLLRVKLEQVLWFCCRVAPFHLPNSILNVLRKPWGLELERLFDDMCTIDDAEINYGRFRKDKDTILKKIALWRAWTYIVQNRTDRRISLQIRAQYQNYVLYDYDNDENFIVLLYGKCVKRYPNEILEALNPDELCAMQENCGNTSKILENLDTILRKCRPVTIVGMDADSWKTSFNEVKEQLQHVTINPKTCWPYVICRITGKHWRECIGPYDVKKDSMVRLFHRYVARKREYPKNISDLVSFYFVVVNNYEPISIMIEEELRCVFEIFEPIMKEKAVEQYLETYNKFHHENERLKYE